MLRHGSCARPAAICPVRRLQSSLPTRSELTASIRASHGSSPPPRSALIARRSPALEFMAVRKEHSFFECCQTPDIASEITLQPIRRYTGLLDAAIILCALVPTAAVHAVPAGKMELRADCFYTAHLSLGQL